MARNVPKRLLWSCRLILRAASLLVPRRQRAEWFREWHAETWHWAHFLVESKRLSPRTEEELLRHCWGAFPDALWHRLNRDIVVKFIHEYPLTPGFCLIVLLAALSVFAGRTLSRSPEWFRPLHDMNTSDLLTLSLSSDSHWLAPEVLQDEAADWARTSPLIAQAATYAWRRSVVRGPEGKEEVVSARVTPGVFGMLRATPILGRTFDPAERSPCANCVVLNESVWRSQFHEGRDVIGKRLLLNGGEVEIIGVLPEHFRLPGVDIGLFTLFGTDSQARLPGLEWPGAILQVRAGVPLQKAKRKLHALVNENSDVPPYATLDVLSAKDIQYQWLESWAVFIGVALLLLALLNWRAISLLRATGPGPTAKSFRWWLFLAAKSSLVVATSLALSFDIAQTTELKFGLVARDYASGMAIWVFVVGLTLGLTWSLRDQLARCRTCLKRLHTKVNLGDSPGALSEPSGVELLCDGGHGILHIPTMSWSCLDSERWTDLDESWQQIGAMQASTLP